MLDSETQGRTRQKKPSRKNQAEKTKQKELGKRTRQEEPGKRTRQEKLSRKSRAGKRNSNKTKNAAGDGNKSLQKILTRAKNLNKNL